jgi:hypothetical protein
MLISKKLNIKVLILQINGNKWFPASSSPEKPSPEGKVKFFARLIPRPKMFGMLWKILRREILMAWKMLHLENP